MLRELRALPDGEAFPEPIRCCAGSCRAARRSLALAVEPACITSSHRPLPRAAKLVCMYMCAALGLPQGNDTVDDVCPAAAVPGSQVGSRSACVHGMHACHAV